MSANDVHYKARRRVSRRCPTVMSRYVRSSSVVNDRLVSTVELREVDAVTDDRSNYTYLDFGLDRVLAVGATQMLNPVSLSPDNVDTVSHIVDSTMNPQPPQSNE